MILHEICYETVFSTALLEEFEKHIMILHEICYETVFSTALLEELSISANNIFLMLK